MIGEIVLFAVLVLPLIFGVTFRVSTSHIFFSLMAGELLGRYFGHDVEAQTKNFLPQSNITGYGEIALIALPMLLTAVFMRNTLSKGKTILHIVPLAITGIVCAAFILPILPEFLQAEVRTVYFGDMLLHLNRVIIGSMIALQLVALWLLNRKEGKSKKSEKD